VPIFLIYRRSPMPASWTTKAGRPEKVHSFFLGFSSVEGMRLAALDFLKLLYAEHPGHLEPENWNWQK
jgi:hypothetical protein